MPKFNPKIYDFREYTCIREWLKIMNQEQLILFKEILSCEEGSTQMIKLDNLMMDMKCNKEMQQKILLELRLAVIKSKELMAAYGLNE